MFRIQVLISHVLLHCSLLSQMMSTMMSHMMSWWNSQYFNMPCSALLSWKLNKGTISSNIYIYRHGYLKWVEPDDMLHTSSISGSTLARKRNRCNFEIHLQVPPTIKIVSVL